VLEKSKNIFLSIAAVGLLASSVTAFAEQFSAAVENKEACPVTAYPTMPVGTDPSIALDLEFGNGAQAITQCLKNRKQLKVVVRVDNTFMTDPFGAARLNAPLFLTNIEKMITQYETTHGLKIGEDIDIRVVFSGTGAVLAATSHGIFAQAATRWNTANPSNPIATGPVNPYRAIVERGMAVGMKFYLCQEASRSLGITMANKIPGINFVPAAHAATADFQMDGYAIIIP
jgi:intracellular sulfur oxidation DsrE/DsrF family protein